MAEDLHLVETELDSRSVFDGALLKVRKDTVRLPNGESSTREYIRHLGAVVIIPLLPDGRMVFERQFRYPLRRVILELPAGKIDPGEDILVTGQRELREETGYEADHWRHLGVTHPCVGYSDERIEIFLASGLRFAGEQALDHNEFIEIVQLTHDEAAAAVREGAITDGKTVTALYWAEKVAREGW